MIKKLIYLLIFLLSINSFAFANNLNSIVRIQSYNMDTGETKYGGSGVIISVKRHRSFYSMKVLTCAHIICNYKNELFRIDKFKVIDDVLTLERFHNGTIFRKNELVDLSLMEFRTRISEGREYKAINIAESAPQVNTKSLFSAYGCPHSKKPHCRTNLKLIFSGRYGFAGEHKDLKWDTYSMGFYPKLGMSGGPLLNSDNELVGILTFRDEQTRHAVYVGLDHINDLLENK